MTDKDKIIDIDNRDKRKIAFFKESMKHFMLNKMEALENDKASICSRIEFRDIEAENYYDFIVNHARIDYARYIFKQISELMDMYL